MDIFFSLLLPVSVTIDNVVIGQNTSLPPSRVAVISTVIHLTFLMVGVYLAPYITPYIPASEHWISPALFTLLGILSLWTVFHHTHQMVASVTGTLFLSSVLAFDALLLGLTPAVTKTLAFVFVGVFFSRHFSYGLAEQHQKAGQKSVDDLAMPRPHFSLVWLAIQFEPARYHGCITRSKNISAMILTKFSTSI